MRRAAITAGLILSVTLLGLSVAFAGGGGNAPPSCPPDVVTCTTIVGPDVEMTVQLDSHNSGVTPTAKKIFWISLTRPDTGATSRAVGLDVPPGWNLSLGCDPTLSMVRFGNDNDVKFHNTLYDWISPGTAVDDLFADVGIATNALDPAPVLNVITSQECLGGAAPILILGSEPGFLRIDGIVRFRVFCGGGSPQPCE